LLRQLAPAPMVARSADVPRNDDLAEQTPADIRHRRSRH
jgi:hypothetical protein